MIYVDATCPLVSKVHIEAAAPRRERPADDHDRPRRPPRDGRHHGPTARGRGAAGRNRRRTWPVCTSRDPARLAFVTQTTLSVDDTADIVAALQAALSRHRRPAQGRHLLRHHQPAGSGQGDGAASAMRCWWSARPIPPIRTVWSRWRTRRLRLCATGPARRRHRLARAGGDHRRGHHRRRQRARSADRRGDRRLPRPLRRDGRAGRDRRENVEFKVPRVLRVPA